MHKPYGPVVGEFFFLITVSNKIKKYITCSIYRDISNIRKKDKKLNGQ